MSKKGPIHVVVSGYKDCPYYRRAVEEAERLARDHENFTFNVVEDSRTAFHEHREKILKQLGKSPDSHKTSPLVYTTHQNKPMDFIGGCDSFLNFSKTEFPPN